MGFQSRITARKRKEQVPLEGKSKIAIIMLEELSALCKGTEAGDAGLSLCGGLAKTTKSLSAFLSWFISSLLVDG